MVLLGHPLSHSECVLDCLGHYMLQPYYEITYDALRWRLVTFACSWLTAVTASETPQTAYVSRVQLVFAVQHPRLIIVQPAEVASKRRVLMKAHSIQNNWPSKEPNILP